MPFQVRSWWRLFELCHRLSRRPHSTNKGIKSTTSFIRNIRHLSIPRQPYVSILSRIQTNRPWTFNNWLFILPRLSGKLKQTACSGWWRPNGFTLNQIDCENLFTSLPSCRTSKFNVNTILAKTKTCLNDDLNYRRLPRVWVWRLAEWNWWVSEKHLVARCQAEVSLNLTHWLRLQIPHFLNASATQLHQIYLPNESWYFSKLLPSNFAIPSNLASNFRMKNCWALQIDTREIFSEMFVFSIHLRRQWFDLGFASFLVSLESLFVFSPSWLQVEQIASVACSRKLPNWFSLRTSAFTLIWWTIKVLSYFDFPL